MAITARPISSRRRDCGPDRGIPLFFDIAIDVLEHDDRVINDNADSERETQQGEAVQRHIKGAHGRERRDDRDRNGQGGNEGAAETVHEQQHTTRPAGCRRSGVR